MDLSTALLCCVAALLGFNNLLFKVPGWEHRRVFFWMLQVVNLLAIIALLAIGIPGFAGATKAINWVLGLLLILHVVGNNGKLVDALRTLNAEERTADSEMRDRMKAALVKGSEE